MKKSWKEKMEHPPVPQIKIAPEDWVSKYEGNKMLIPTPRAIEEIIATIRKGRVMTIAQLRMALAQKYEADFTCPLTAGIFLNVVAEYAEELKTEGKKRIPCYWRVVRNDGAIIEKFPGGATKQMAYLKEDGVDVITKGKYKNRVRSFVSE